MATEAFGDRYPIPRKQFIQQAGVNIEPGSGPKFFASQGLSAFQFLSTDEKEIVQVRTGGFSYNRLSPYTSLDDYLPEISRCWDVFRDLASPVQIRKIGLRYINRILLPLNQGVVKLDDYLKVSPNLPGDTSLQFSVFSTSTRRATPQPASWQTSPLPASQTKTTFSPYFLILRSLNPNA